jgi:hypothetical protein
LTGLAHQGYTPQTAIADIIDNSISANATEIKVTFASQLDESTQVWIADNGDGMDLATLEAAMQIGSSAGLANSSLSVYGMGMKAASMSFSNKFTVVTRNKKGETFEASWDLLEQSENPWTIDIGEATGKHSELLDRTANGNPGTLVIWEKADFKNAILDTRKISGRKPGIRNIEPEIMEYLSMAFHRFLEGKVLAFPNVKMYFNENLLVPWNPVADEYLSDVWQPVTDDFEVALNIDGNVEMVPYSLTTYLLKSRAEYGPKDEDSSKLGMRTQGIYPYRENRLLQYPDWLGVLTFHPDWNSLRAVLELDPRLDSITRTDMKKSGLTLPPQMWADLKEKLELYSRNLRNQNKTRKAQLRAKTDTQSMHKGSNVAINISLPDIERPKTKSSPDGTTKVETLFGESITELAQVDIAFSSRDTRIQPVSDLEGGVLFEPVLQGGEQVILLNKSHPFYQKIYMGLYDVPLAIQGMDFLIYSLAHAELLTRTDRIKEQFRRMRFEMSESLRLFVLDIEEPRDFVDGDGNEIVA